MPECLRTAENRLAPALWQWAATAAAAAGHAWSSTQPGYGVRLHSCACAVCQQASSSHLLHPRCLQKPPLPLPPLLLLLLLPGPAGLQAFSSQDRCTCVCVCEPTHATGFKFPARSAPATPTSAMLTITCVHLPCSCHAYMHHTDTPPLPDDTHRISSTMLLSALSMCHTPQCWHWQNTAPRAHAVGLTSRAERPPFLGGGAQRGGVHKQPHTAAAGRSRPAAMWCQ